jgi:putative hemolysin
MGELVVVVVCIGLNGLLACVEMAFVSASRPTLRKLAAQGRTDAAQVLELRRTPERTLSVLQIGITAMGALAAAVSGAGVQDSLTPRLAAWLGTREAFAEALALLLLVGPFTYLTVLAGELIPKSLALRRSVPIAMRSARWLRLLDRILAPAVSILEASTRWALRKIFRIRPSVEKEPGPEPSAPLVDLGKLSGAHRKYVANLLEIERKRVGDIALPWGAVASVSAGQPGSEVQSLVLASGHTRVPVLRGNDIVGLLHTKEFLAFRAAGGEDWSALVRPIVRLSAEATLLGALRMLQSARSHMAVVLSDSTPSGILTLEDVFEEVVGEIHDEADDLFQRLIVRRPPEMNERSLRGDQR